jgi:hypothetical protein
MTRPTKKTDYLEPLVVDSMKALFGERGAKQIYTLLRLVDAGVTNRQFAGVWRDEAVEPHVKMTVELRWTIWVEKFLVEPGDPKLDFSLNT